MNINLTEKQYGLLVELVYFGNLMMKKIHDEDNLIKEYEQLWQYIISFINECNYDVLDRIDMKSSRELLPNGLQELYSMMEIEEGISPKAFISYNNETFIEEEHEELDKEIKNHKVVIDLIPLAGIKIDSAKVINFGQNINDVISVLGEPEARSDKSLYYINSNLCIFLDENKCVQEIQVSTDSRWKTIESVIYGSNAFMLGTNELIEILSNINNGRVHKEGNRYYFMELSIGIWQEMTKEAMEQIIEEAKHEDDYDLRREELEDDLEKYSHFQTITIGIKGIYSEYA